MSNCEMCGKRTDELTYSFVEGVKLQVCVNCAKYGKFALKKEKGVKALSAKGKLDGIEAVLAMPLTFMNVSGEAFVALLKKYKVELEDCLVVCDDLDLEFGRIKIRSGGSSAGHRGIQSIIDHLGSDGFSRVRIGIGRPKDKAVSDYVLSHFNRKEKSQLRRIIKRAEECCLVWVSQGVEKSMNIFNKKGNGHKGEFNNE